MDTSAITAAAQASSSSYRSFADDTRAVLDLSQCDNAPSPMHN